MKDKLLKIQAELKAPKNQRNSFGNYNYRSCEDILEAVKPLLIREQLLLRLTDELVQVGERYYIKATAILTDGNEIIENTSYAREEENKKGMDGSQITGASSSYARKYALNGLFLIDDVQDSDSTNKGKEKSTTTDKPEPASKAQVDMLEKIYADHQDKKKEFLDKYKLNSFADLTKKTASDLIKAHTKK